jgi:hypothetical protein
MSENTQPADAPSDAAQPAAVGHAGLSASEAAFATEVQAELARISALSAADQLDALNALHRLLESTLNEGK